MRDSAEDSPLVASLWKLSELKAGDRRAILALMDKTARQRICAHLKRLAKARRKKTLAQFGLQVLLYERGLSPGLSGHLLQALEAGGASAENTALRPAIDAFVRNWAGEVASAAAPGSAAPVTRLRPARGPVAAPVMGLAGGNAFGIAPDASHSKGPVL